MSSKALPPALEPYLRLPPEASSLILLTSTLGCSVNWLNARFMSNAISSSHAVLLVSWLRDLNFWKNELRRTSGIDITKLQETHQFAFIDCFNNNPTSSSKLEDLHQTIHLTISNLQAPILLVLDNPDILLATTTTLTSTSLSDFLLALRSEPRIHATILSLSADLPNIAGGINATPIEAETAAFTIGQAHASKWVLGVRELETGAAKDVSGVLRITRGGEFYDDDVDVEKEEVKEAELLYLVQRDGGVKVFGRGVVVM